MTDPTPPTAPDESLPIDSSKDRKKSGGSPGGLITRVVVWGAVIALAAVVLEDVRARRAAQKTADAWGDAMNDHTIIDGSEFELRPDRLRDYVVGNPTVRPAPDDEAAKHGEDRLVEDYVWSGPFREHVVRVISIRGEHPVVERFDTPGVD